MRMILWMRVTDQQNNIPLGDFLNAFEKLYNRDHAEIEKNKHLKGFQSIISSRSFVLLALNFK